MKLLLSIFFLILVDLSLGLSIPKREISQDMRMRKLRSLFFNTKKPEPKDNPTYSYTTAWYPNMPVDHLRGTTSDTFRLR